MKITILDDYFDTLRTLNESGTTVVVVEQNATLALSVARHAYVLETGRIVKAGTGAELLNDPAVKDPIGFVTRELAKLGLAEVLS